MSFPILLGFIALGFIDLFVTIHGLRLGFIYEANPWMAYLFGLGNAYAVGYHLLANVGGLTFVWVNRWRGRWIIACLWVLLILRLVVIGGHVRWLTAYYL